MGAGLGIGAAEEVEVGVGVDADADPGAADVDVIWGCGCCGWEAAVEATGGGWSTKALVSPFTTIDFSSPLSLRRGSSEDSSIVSSSLVGTLLTKEANNFRYYSLSADAPGGRMTVVTELRRPTRKLERPTEAGKARKELNWLAGWGRLGSQPEPWKEA